LLSGTNVADRISVVHRRFGPGWQGHEILDEDDADDVVEVSR
jgi:hypothetical protein